MSPYDKLYIYEIRGIVQHPSQSFEKDFLGCWQEGDYAFLFFSRESKDEVFQFLSFQQHLSYLSETIMDYKDWEAGNKLAPLRIHNILIYPAWEDPPEFKGGILIPLDPGLAFGSGYHPTSHDCLAAISNLFALPKRRKDYQYPKTVMDLGTGTGLLAIGAARLGAQKVVAVDNNNLAIDTAKKNARLNGVEDKIEFFLGEAGNFLTQPADLLCANLFYRVIDQLLNAEAFYHKKWYIISGLLASEKGSIERRLEEGGIKVLETFGNKGWFTLTARKEN